MTNVKWVFLTILALGVPLLSAHSESSNLEISDHKAWSQIYETKAQEQAAVVADHKKMRDSVGKYYGLSTAPSGTIDLAIGREMQAHCDDIIAAAEKLKEEYLKFAEWHEQYSAKP